MFNFATTPPDESTVKKLLIVARHSPSRRERDAAKVELFESCGTTIKQVVGGYMARMKAQYVKKSFLFEEEDIYSESWRIYQGVVNNFGRLNKIEGRRNGEFDDHNIEYDYAVNGFGNYLKKSLQRQLHRHFQKHFGKGETEALDADAYSWVTVKAGDTSLEERSENFDIEAAGPRIFGLDEDETLLYETRLEGVTMKQFCKSYPEIDEDRYRDTLASVREKVSAVIENTDYETTQTTS